MTLSAASVARFFAKVDRSPRQGPTGECHQWTGFCNKTGGYGRLTIGRRDHWAHRVAWLIHYGPIPKGMRVLHHCDWPRCVRPDHLFLGTQRDNMADAVAKGHVRRGEDHYLARLSPSLVRRIRALRESGSSVVSIAREISVSQGAVDAVVRGVTWRHIL